MIVWLASYPRSGNTFLRIVLHRVFGVPSVEKYYREILAGEGTLGPHLLTSLSDEEMAAADTLYFVKTHDLAKKDGTTPAIYLVRDGRDALVSYAWHTLGEYEKRDADSVRDEDYRRAIHDLMLDDRSPFGTWSQNVTSWVSRPKTIVITYENLIAQPEETLESALRQLGLPCSPDPTAGVPTFRELQEEAPAFFRRGKIGAWRDEFPPDLLPVFWRVHGTTMKRLGYSRSAE